MLLEMDQLLLSEHKFLFQNAGNSDQNCSYVNEKISLISVIIGLVSGLLLFPNQTFDKSILIGGMFPAEAFPVWISTALLFWSFVLATFTPMITVMIFKRNSKFNFAKIKTLIKG